MMPTFLLFWGWRVDYNSIFCDVQQQSTIQQMDVW